MTGRDLLVYARMNMSVLSARLQRQDGLLLDGGGHALAAGAGRQHDVRALHARAAAHHAAQRLVRRQALCGAQAYYW